MKTFTEAQLKMMAAQGLTEKDFAPATDDKEQQIKELMQEVTDLREALNRLGVETDDE